MAKCDKRCRRVPKPAEILDSGLNLDSKKKSNRINSFTFKLSKSSKQETFDSNLAEFLESGLPLESGGKSKLVKFLNIPVWGNGLVFHNCYQKSKGENQNDRSNWKTLNLKRRCRRDSKPAEIVNSSPKLDSAGNFNRIRVNAFNSTKVSKRKTNDSIPAEFLESGLPLDSGEKPQPVDFFNFPN